VLTSSTFEPSLVPEGGKRVGDHSHKFKRRSLAVKHPLEFIHEALERASEHLPEASALSLAMGYMPITYSTKNKSDLSHNGYTLCEERYSFPAIIGRSEYMHEQRIGAKNLRRIKCGVDYWDAFF
jgi:hypothetical protein